VEGKKFSCAKVVKCFGSTSDPEQLAEWIKAAQTMKEECANQNISIRKITTIRRSQDITSCKVYDLGFKCFYSQIFASLFAKLNLTTKDKQILTDLVVMRLATPLSKLATASIAANFGIEMETNQIYRFMDKLDDKQIASIKKSVFQNTKKLLGNKISVIFYDLTTIYFEANNVSDLKEFGYSKDGKSQHVQISLALIVTDNGMPIGYEIFKGNSFEGSTLIPTLNKLREEYDTDDVTIVADSAMLSKSNIEALIANRFKFIVAARIRNLGAKLTKAILNDDDYVYAVDVRYKTIDLGDGQRLITAFSEAKLKKDQYDRERALHKISKLVGKQSKNGLRGVLKKPYIKINCDSIIELDERKIEESKKLDGYFGFVSNTNLSPDQVVAQYRGLWQVEQSFRITKHNLKIRPVYHYKDRRIKAHFAICYLSLALLRSVEYQLNQAGLHMPIEVLHRYLSEIREVVLITKEQSEASIITDVPPEIASVFIALKLATPQRYLAKSRV
jgi:transposase